MFDPLERGTRCAQAEAILGTQKRPLRTDQRVLACSHCVAYGPNNCGKPGRWRIVKVAFFSAKNVGGRWPIAVRTVS